ncbi:MAG: hypothetical protein WDW38_001990 [Sanguina aurantia]
MDHLVAKIFGPTWINNVVAANITYWFIAALDPQTSILLANLGVVNCFNAPVDRLTYHGRETNYKWGSNHWQETTWSKVHVVKAVYEMGFHILHSDTDVTWFHDPLSWFDQWGTQHANILMSTDMVSTHNGRHHRGPEVSTNPHTNINTGVYYVRQWPGGRDFFEEWVTWQPKKVGHDQDAMNFIIRGKFFQGNQEMPVPEHVQTHNEFPVIRAAYNRTAAVSFLPGSSFGNAYTYVNTRLHDVLNHTLFEVHYVWGGSTLEAKRQNMRDAMKFTDVPEYYDSPYLVSMDLEMPTVSQ